MIFRTECLSQPRLIVGRRAAGFPNLKKEEFGGKATNITALDNRKALYG